MLISNKQHRITPSHVTSVNAELDFYGAKTV